MWKCVIIIYLSMEIVLPISLPLAVLPSQYTRDTMDGTEIVNVVNIILGATSNDPFIILITDKTSLIGEVVTRWGLGVFEVAVDGQDADMIHTKLSRIVAQARQLRQVSWSVTVVVVSDNPAFLAAFAELSQKGRLLVWSTRLLILTRLQLHQLNHMRNTLAMTNSMLIVLPHTSNSKCAVYVQLPFQSTDFQPTEVAHLTNKENMKIKLRSDLFPYKFNRFPNKVELLVAKYVTFYKTKMISDLDAPGKRRVVSWDAVVRCLETIGDAMNFRFTLVASPDGHYGAKLPNGSFTGMIRQIYYKEVDMGVGLFSVTPERAEVVDFTYPVMFETSRLITGLPSPEIDPWSFLSPLTAVVWLALLAGLVGVLVVLILMPSCLPTNTDTKHRIFKNAVSCVQVLLHQPVENEPKWWWWERMLVGMWMLMMLVLMLSYTGNLTSLLAVRYIPYQIQTLQDVVDKPVFLLIPKGTAQWQAFMKAKKGVMKEIADLEPEGRLISIQGMANRAKRLRELMILGNYLEVYEETSGRTEMGDEFSKTGRCDYYMSNERFLPMMSAMAGPQDGPLVPALSRRIMAILEAGLYNHWFATFTPNYSACLNPPKKVIMKTTLKIANVWGTLVVLVGGIVFSVIVFILELFCFRIR